MNHYLTFEFKDWSNCELASRYRDASSSEVLLPPTPSLVEKIKSEQSDTNKPVNLQLLSPTPCKPGSSSDPIATVTPISTGQVMRRFPRQVTTDQSPLLRQSLIQSTRLRVEDDQRQNLETDSLSSLDVFSPVLSSTRSQSQSSNPVVSTSHLDMEVPPGSNINPEGSENPEPFSTTAAAFDTFGSLRVLSEAFSDNGDATQTKIDDYKRILLSAKSKDQLEGDSRTSLLSAWNMHRQSLSPQTPRINLSICSSDNGSSPPTLKNMSSMFADRTPDMTRRLDQLMSSLTFGDDSLDLSLGKMSLGGDELLSPQCP